MSCDNFPVLSWIIGRWVVFPRLIHEFIMTLLLRLTFLVLISSPHWYLKQHTHTKAAPSCCFNTSLFPVWMSANVLQPPLKHSGTKNCGTWRQSWCFSEAGCVSWKWRQNYMCWICRLNKTWNISQLMHQDWLLTGKFNPFSEIETGLNINMSDIKCLIWSFEGQFTHRGMCYLGCEDRCLPSSVALGGLGLSFGKSLTLRIVIFNRAPGLQKWDVKVEKRLGSSDRPGV